MKLFHEDNSRLRYLTREEYDRLIEAVRALATRASRPSPYLEEKIVLAVHTGLRRGSLFDLRWEQVDLANSVMRIPRTKSGRPLSVPLNATAKGTLEKLSKGRDPENPYVFPHKLGKNAGEPVHDVKNGFHAALELAGIEDFTWHGLRHTFASWLMMRGASLRSVAELLVDPPGLLCAQGLHIREKTTPGGPLSSGIAFSTSRPPSGCVHGYIRHCKLSPTYPLCSFARYHIHSPSPVWAPGFAVTGRSMQHGNRVGRR